MARTHLDDTPEYKDSVREAIVAREPELVDNDGLDEHALDLASCYLWWNGYKTDGTIDAGHILYASSNGDPKNDIGTVTTEPAYIVYSVLKWTEENT